MIPPFRSKHHCVIFVITSSGTRARNSRGTRLPSRWSISLRFVVITLILDHSIHPHPSIDPSLPSSPRSSDMPYKARRLRELARVRLVGAIKIWHDRPHPRRRKKNGRTAGLVAAGRWRLTGDGRGTGRGLTSADFTTRATRRAKGTTARNSLLSDRTSSWRSRGRRRRRAAVIPSWPCGGPGRGHGPLSGHKETKERPYPLLPHVRQ